MKKFLIGFLTVCCLLFCMPVLSASAAVTLYDEGNRLTPEENSQCLKRLGEASQNTGMNIIVILSSAQYSDNTIESMVKQTYDLTYDAGTDGLCYYMDLSGREHPYDYIDTSGLAQFYYTNSSDNNRIDRIFSALDTYLYPVGRENVPGALEEFANQLEYYYERGIPDNYYLYDDVYHQYGHVENGQIIYTNTKPADWGLIMIFAVIGLIFGGIASLIVYHVIKSKYRFKTELSPTNYVNKKTVVYHQQYDHFVTTRVTRRHIDRSGGGGGHHSGGGGHSSGGHGGGGHHR